jgi:integrase/recombinase XerC
MELPRGIRRRGGVLWVDVRVNGQRVRRPAGKTLAEAERLRAQILEGKESDPTGPTFEDLTEKYLAKLRVTAKAASVVTAESVIRRLKRHFGARDPRSLTAEDIRIYQAARIATVSRAAVNKEARYLRSILRLAVEEGLLEKVPFKFTMLRTPRKSPTILTPEETRRLLEVVGSLGPLLLVAAYTGLRNGELCALRWRDVDLVDGVLHVAARDGWSPKSHRDRHVPLHPAAVRELEALRARSKTEAADGNIFKNARGKSWKPTHLSRAVRRAYQDAKLYRKEDKPGLHMLRRTFLSTLLHTGTDIETARELAGHSSVIVTQAYLSSTDRVKRRAVEGLPF